MNNMNEQTENQIQKAAERYAQLLNKLTITNESSEQLSIKIDQYINDNDHQGEAVVKIISDFFAIEELYKEFGYSPTDSKSIEIDVIQATEISNKSLDVINNLITYLQKNDVLNNNEIIDRLLNEKSLYEELSSITKSLSLLTENTSNSTEDEISISSNIDTQNQTLDELLEDPEIKQALEVYDLDPINLELWQEAVDEVKQTLDTPEAYSSTVADIDELLEKIDDDNLSIINQQSLHTLVSADINAVKSSTRDSLEQEYKNILNSLVQVNKEQYDDSFSAEIIDNQKKITKMYKTLTALGEDSLENINIDKDKYNLASQFCKLTLEKIIVGQYHQFMQNVDKALNSESMTSEERQTLGTLHGKLVNNIQEYVVNQNLNEALDTLWVSCDNAMKSVNEKYDSQSQAKKQKEKTNTDHPPKEQDIQILSAKIDKAIVDKNTTMLNDIKSILYQQQTQLNKSLDSAIHSPQSIGLLKDKMKEVHECLNKINQGLGITPKLQKVEFPNIDKPNEANMPGQ